MATENQFMKDARIRGLIDGREIAFMVDVICTNGNNGRAWMLLNGSMLHLCEPVGMVKLGELLESLDLEKAELVKASSFVLNPFVKLRYAGEVYTFRGFAQAKRVVETIRECCKG